MSRPRTITSSKARPPTAWALAGLVLAACWPAPKAPVRLAPPDPILAKVNGAPIYRSDVVREAANRGLGEEPAISAGLLDQMVDRKLLADQAVKDGLDRSLDGRRRLEAAREQVLSDLALENELRGVVSPEAVAGLYQEMEKAKPATTPSETLDQARPRIVRFLTYERVKDLVLDLRHRAKIEIVRQPDAKGSEP